jgi:hypothetical protein
VLRWAHGKNTRPEGATAHDLGSQEIARNIARTAPRAHNAGAGTARGFCDAGGLPVDHRTGCGAGEDGREGYRKARAGVLPQDRRDAQDAGGRQAAKDGIARQLACARLFGYAIQRRTAEASRSCFGDQTYASLSKLWQAKDAAAVSGFVAIPGIYPTTIFLVDVDTWNASRGRQHTSTAVYCRYLQQLRLDRVLQHSCSSL